MNEGPNSRTRLFNLISARVSRIPFLLYGLLLFCVGIAVYFVGVLLFFPRYFFGLNALLMPLNETIVWYSGVPVLSGIVLALIDLIIFFPSKRLTGQVRHDPPRDRMVTVALTAYDDEISISSVVEDFKHHPQVRSVIVISNNSHDGTLNRALEAGAIAFDEPRQGYGQCVWRCWSEALKHDETELIVLCEGDMTFRAYDIDKLSAYAPHADI